MPTATADAKSLQSWGRAVAPMTRVIRHDYQQVLDKRPRGAHPGPKTASEIIYTVIELLHVALILYFFVLVGTCLCFSQDSAGV